MFEITVRPTQGPLPIIKLGNFGKITFEQIVTLTNDSIVAIPYFKSDESITISLKTIRDLERHNVTGMMKTEIIYALKSMQQQLERVVEELKK